MNTNISKYKKDFDKLVNLGNDLLNAMKYACYPIVIKRDEEKEDKKIRFR